MKIVYANTIDFEGGLQQRPHHLFALLAKRGHQVYWVNKTKNNDKFRTRITNGLNVYHDWEAFCRKFEGQIDVYFSSWSHRHEDIDLIKPKMTIYDSLDLFPGNQSEEKNMVDKADVILTTTNNLYDFHKEHTNKPIYMCENGCFSEYRNTTYDIPKDLKDLPKPWILFSGAVAINPKHGWVDADLIQKISQKYTTIVVGRMWELSPSDGEIRKKKLSKVNFLGVKSYSELQAYYAHCDVNILPFQRCQTADYSHPLKLIEGCNMGKPCVATDIPVAEEFSKNYPDAVLVSSTYSKFLSNIEKVLRVKDEEKVINQCFKLADDNDWNKKVDIIEKSISDYCDKNNIIIE